MAPATQIVLSGVLTFGVPLFIAARELAVLRRPPRGSWRPDRPDERPPGPPLGWHPSLPDYPCRINPPADPDRRTPGLRERVVESV